MTRYAIVNKQDGHIYKVFDLYPEALYYIADCPKRDLVEIVEVNHNDLWG